MTALGRGSASTRADEAYVVVVVADDDDEASDPLTKKDRDAVVAGIRKLGVAEDDIDIATQFDYGLVTIVQVEVQVADLGTKGKTVVDAVEDVLGRSDTSGVQFWHSQCSALLTKARSAAVEDGKRRAQQLAEAGGVILGRLQHLSEAGGGGPGSSCNDDAGALISFDEYAPELEPFDAEPRFTISAQALVGFAIG